jgi:hypothetical protein
MRTLSALLSLFLVVSAPLEALATPGGPKSVDAGVIRNGSASVTVPTTTTTLIGTDTTSVVTNKDIDGGTASNTHRITLPKASTSTLSGLTRKQGTLVFDTDRNKPLYDNGSALNEIGSGSGGGINYISDSGIETDASAWSTYADAAGASPVDGTGGSPSHITVSRTTSSPLRGNGSLSIVNSGSTSAQGEGVSTAITIDAADKAKPLKVSFDYIVSSGTFVASSGTSASDLTVYLYDVTNSTVIQPAGYTLVCSSTSIPCQYSGTFQTASNSTSYRLIFHVATTNTSAWTLKLDNFYVGPQTTAAGTVGTDSVAWTPTGSWSTNTTYSGQKWRVGDKAYYTVHIALAGAPTSATLTVNLPAGEVIDTSKGTWGANNTVVGGGSVQHSSSANQDLVSVVYSSTTAVLVSALQTDTGSNPRFINQGQPVNSTNPVTPSAGDYYDLNIGPLPIVGWSSSSVMSSDSDTRVVAARAHISADRTPGTSQINYDTVDYDTHGMITTGASWKATLPMSGFYRVSGVLDLSSAPASGSLGLYKNGSIEVGLSSLVSANKSAGFSATIKGNAGDFIDLRPNTTGGTFDSSGSGFVNNVMIERLSGPATIAATETVAARYYASGTSISGSLATVSWTTKDFDTHGGMSSGTYTVPVSGKYQINTGLRIQGTFALNNTVSFQLQKNGSVVTEQGGYAGGAITAFTANLSDTINCLAGDTIRVQAASSATGPSITSSNSLNYFSLERVGN